MILYKTISSFYIESSGDLRLHIEPARPCHRCRGRLKRQLGGSQLHLLGTTLPQPACSPEGHCLHTQLTPNARMDNINIS